jgi:hypothetical protein
MSTKNESVLTIEVKPLDHDPDERRQPGCMVTGLSECALRQTRRAHDHTHRVDDTSLSTA